MNVRKDDKIKESITILVEAGCDVAINKNLLYRNGDNKYTILRFTAKSDLKSDGEERFDKLDKAVARFIEISGEKL